VTVKVFRTQRGSAVLDSDSTLTDVSITAVVMGRSRVRAWLRKNTSQPRKFLLEVNLQTSTNFQMRVEDWFIGGINVEWEVTEYSAESGITIQRGLNHGATSISISALNHAHVELNKRNATTDLGSDDFVTGDITSISNLTITQDDSEAAFWQVTDWKRHANVVKVNISIGTGTGNQNFTISPSLTDFSKAAIVGNSSAGGSVNVDQLYRLYTINNSQGHMQRYTTGVAFEIIAYVIEFLKGWDVQPFTGETMAATELTNNTIISAVDMNKTSLYNGSHNQWITAADISDDDAGEAAITLKLTTSTNVEGERATSAVVNLYALVVVEDVGINDLNLAGNLAGNLLGGYQDE